MIKNPTLFALAALPGLLLPALALSETDANSQDLAGLLGEPLPSVAMARPPAGPRAVDCEDQPGIVIQDDGTIENGYGGNPSTIDEVRFVDLYTPEAYPARLTGVCVALITISGEPTLDIDIVVYDDSGTDGAPGALIDSLSVTVDVDTIEVPVPPDQLPLWTAIDLSSLDIEVSSGSVFIGVRYEPPEPNVFLAADQSDDRPVGFAGGYWWTTEEETWAPIETAFFEYRALMVRPVLLTDPEAEISPASLSFTLDAGNSASDQLTIANLAEAGAQNLDWSIDAVEQPLAGGRFEGDFDIDNWTFENDPEDVNGSFSTVAGPPVELYILGGDDGAGGNADLWIEIPANGTITFDWGYQSSDTGEFDSGGYVVNGNYTVLAFNNTQVPFFDESATVEVSAGDIFAFRVQTDDGLFGAGELGVTNFQFTPDLCSPENAASWLTASPDSGSTAPGDSEAVTVAVDTAGLAAGQYDGLLCLNTNDPNAAQALVPVSLQVIDASLGVLEGTVTSLGQCGTEPVALAGANVTVLGDNGSLFETTTDADGSYSLMIPEGESPLEVLLEHPDHLADTATGVPIAAGETTVLDFELVLEAPCATVQPQSLQALVEQGDTASRSLEIGNQAGGAELNWTLETAQVPAGAGQAAPFSIERSQRPSPSAVALSDQLDGPVPGLRMARSSSGPMAMNCEDEPGIIIQDDGVVNNGYSGNPATITEARFVDRYTPAGYPAVLESVCVAFITLEGEPTLDLEIVVYDDSGVDGAPGQELGSLPATVDVETLDLPIPPGQEPTWTAIDLSSLDIEVSSGSLYIGVRVEPQDPNSFIAADENPDRPAGFAGGYRWYSDTEEWQPTETAFPDYRALMIRPALMTEAQACDAPEAIGWLDVSHDAGSVAAGDSVTVDVVFDADGLAEGLYQALLCLNSNDPSRPVIEIPVTMTVGDDAIFSDRFEQ
ncbi:MAG: carboxypeptidase-like regulatory domain-containing protein [Wenzhouxiangella sp.]